MNLGSTSSAIPSQIQSAQGLAVLKQAMNAQKLEGQAAVKLIDSAPVPPPPAQGTGTLVDVQA